MGFVCILWMACDDYIEEQVLTELRIDYCKSQSTTSNVKLQL